MKSLFSLGFITQQMCRSSPSPQLTAPQTLPNLKNVGGWRVISWASVCNKEGRGGRSELRQKSRGSWAKKKCTCSAATTMEKKCKRTSLGAQNTGKITFRDIESASMPGRGGRRQKKSANARPPRLCTCNLFFRAPDATNFVATRVRADGSARQHFGTSALGRTVDWPDWRCKCNLLR